MDTYQSIVGSPRMTSFTVVYSMYKLYAAIHYGIIS